MPIKTKDMLHRVYTMDFDQILECRELQNCDIQYHIKNSIVRCSNMITLYSLCLYLYKRIQKQHYRQLKNYELTIHPDVMQQAVYYLNRATYKHLQWVQYDQEAQIILQYLCNDLGHYDVKMVIKFQSDLEESRINNKDEVLYFIVYFEAAHTRAKIEEFKYNKIEIKDEVIKNKLELVGITEEGEEEQVIRYGTANGQDVYIKRMYLPSNQNQDKSSTLNITSNRQKSFYGQCLHPNFQCLVIYGQKQIVDVFTNKLYTELQTIKIAVFKKGEPLFYSYIFETMKKMCEKYHKCRTFLSENRQSIIVYYHQSIEDIFNTQIMKYQNYKAIKASSVKPALKQPTLVTAKEKLWNLMSYQDKINGQMLVSDKQTIQSLQKLTQKKTKQRKQQRKAQQIIAKNAKQNFNRQDYTIQFLNNIQISEQNYKQIISVCKQIKVQQYMTYKIDIGSSIRLTNRIKKYSSAYLIFEKYSQLIQLQSILQQNISIKQFERIIHEYSNESFHKPKILISQDGNFTLKIYPATDQMFVNREKYYLSLLEDIKKESNISFRYILCTFKIFKEIINTTVIESITYFVINQQIPCFQCDDLIEKQTQVIRNYRSKSQLDYYCDVKAEVCNVSFRNNQIYKKDEDILRDIMSKNIHQYEVGNYLLSQVDEYNISFMIGEGLKKMFLILSRKPTEQFIYITYHQKLVRVLRDRYGNFADFRQAAINKDISKENAAAIKPVLKRAFLTGQKYVGINLPFEHVKLVSLDNINRMQINNHNIIRYYLKKLNESQRYKVVIKSPYTGQYFQRKFAKFYILKFENKELKKSIKQLHLGYSKMRKERQKPFICLFAEYFVCQKVLKQFEEEYEKKIQKESIRDMKNK